MSDPEIPQYDYPRTSIEPCRCKWEWRNYRGEMPEWVRVTTELGCREHGRAAGERTRSLNMMYTGPICLISRGEMTA